VPFWFTGAGQVIGGSCLIGYGGMIFCFIVIIQEKKERKKERGEK
jgi:hypothetical protein